MKRAIIFAILLAAGAMLWPAPGFSQTPAPVVSKPEAFTPSGVEDLTRQQELSLHQAKKIALDNNLDLANARRDIRLAELDITRAKAGYDPYFKVDATYNSGNRPSSTGQAFGQETKSASLNFTTGVTTTTGGNASLAFNNTEQQSDSVFTTLNPSYNTELALNVTQPLLKNAYADARAMDITQKKNDLERSKLALDSKVMEIESQVEENYWGLVRARLDLSLKRQALDLALRMGQITTSQVNAGQAAPVSTLQTDANAASARAALVRSENDYRKAQFTLKVALNLEADDLWYLEVIPTDVPKYDPPDFSRDDVLKEALANNIPLRQARLSLDSAEVSNEQAKNRTLPQLDLRGSVSLSGLAGKDNPQNSTVQTGFVVPNPLPTPQPYIMETIVVPSQPNPAAGNYNDAVQNMLDSDNLSWSAGLTFNVPIGNRAAKADYERTMLNYEKQLSDLHDQERQVYMNVINLLYDLDASHRNFLAAREASRLQEQNLTTEEKKFSVGLNTNYEVLQAQENWGEAKSSEIGALVDYTKSTGRIGRARKGYVSGGTGSLTTSVPGSLNLGSGASTGGMDASQLQGLMGAGSLPAGVDVNSLRSMAP